MNYTDHFKRIVNNPKYDYIGNGNPNAKILIISKEPSIDRNANPDMYLSDVLGNRKLWQDRISGSLNLSNGKDPLFPYKGQKFKLNTGNKKYSDEHDGNGGTSRTWMAYQKLYDMIAGNKEKSHDDFIDFHKYIFTTDLSAEVAKSSDKTDFLRTKKSIEGRVGMFSEDFFQDFPVVILAVGHYPKSYGLDMQKLFGVKWTGCTRLIGKKWVNIHYDGRMQKIVIHTNQLSRYTNDLIAFIANEIREFIANSLKVDIAGFLHDSAVLCDLQPEQIV